MSYFSGLVQSNVIITAGTKIITPVWNFQAGAGTLALYTCPAGKKASLLTFNMQEEGAGAVELKINAVSVARVYSVATQRAITSNAWEYGAAPIITSGQTFAITQTGVGTGECGISFIEESV
jgi:hypothetical protein